MKSQYDVVILGGGLAGLTLALQLRQRFADLDILVLERRRHPVPEAAHKVGESSVEIGAHYFSHGARPEAAPGGAPAAQVRLSLLLREGRRDIDPVTEIGASRYLSVPSYQIDRGIFENFLGEEAQRLGMRLHRRRAWCSDVELGENGAAASHRLDAPATSSTATEARWVVDACGRAGLLKRKLGLAQANAHDANAVWFRISDRIDIDDWSGRRRTGTRAASRRRAGSRPTTWSAPATGCG